MLYIDTDVILNHETPDLFEVVPTGHVAMHDDWDEFPSYDWVFYERRIILESQGLAMDETHVVLNNGVVVSNRKHASIWKPPERPFFPTHCSEQFLIQNNAREFPNYPLATEFNTQYWMPRFWELLSTTKVVHLSNCLHEKRLELVRQFALPTAVLSMEGVTP